MSKPFTVWVVAHVGPPRMWWDGQNWQKHIVPKCLMDGARARTVAADLSRRGFPTMVLEVWQVQNTDPVHGHWHTWQPKDDPLSDDQIPPTQPKQCPHCGKDI